MRTYEQLTENEREEALGVALHDLLRAIVEGGFRFDDEKNGDDLQARIDRAGEEAERMQTPWFWSEYVLDTAGDDLRSMAQADAEDAVYPEPGERVIRLPVTSKEA